MRIEFFLTTALEISHFASIARALIEKGVDATFISPQPYPKARYYGWDDADRTQILLNSMRLPWTKEPNFDADAVITIQTMPWVKHYKGLKIRASYGVGLVAPIRQQELDSPPFDYHFVNGPFGQRVQFSQHTLPSPDLPPERVKVIGYPRFDDWFHVFEWRKPDATKPILLWLPTWGESSSVDRYADAIEKLADKYDIWVKPHHGMVHWERSRMTRLAQMPARLIDYTDPPEPSFAAASIVLADLASGALAEAMFLRKAIVALAKPDEVARLLSSTCPFSICTASGNKMLEALIMGAQSAKIRPAEDTRREDIRRDLFDSTEGADGERAAKIIMECVECR
jgi:hypothetical protein